MSSNPFYLPYGVTGIVATGPGDGREPCHWCGIWHIHGPGLCIECLGGSRNAGVGYFTPLDRQQSAGPAWRYQMYDPHGRLREGRAERPVYVVTPRKALDGD